MTQLNLTHGQILDLVEALFDREDEARDNGDEGLAGYYANMALQFSKLNEKLEERPGEKREAVLVLVDA